MSARIRILVLITSAALAASQAAAQTRDDFVDCTLPANEDNDECLNIPLPEEGTNFLGVLLPLAAVAAGTAALSAGAGSTTPSTTQ